MPHDQDMMSTKSQFQRESTDPITPFKHLGLPLRAPDVLQTSSPCPHEAECHARPSAARSEDSTSSQDSVQSYDTPMTSPETSPQETPFQLAEGEEKTFLAQLPPTPTPSPRGRGASVRSNSAVIKPPAKTRKRKGGVKTVRKAIIRKLFEDDGRSENDPTISELSEKLRLLKISASADPGGEHCQIEENNGNSEANFPQECGLHLRIQEQRSLAGKLPPENINTRSQDGRISDISAENRIVPESSGPSPEREASATNPMQSELSDVQATSQTNVVDPGEMETLEETAMLYPSFQRKHRSHLSQYRIHQEIASELRRGLTTTSSTGYLYIFRLPLGQTKYIKIGRTKEEAQKRTEHIRRACDLGELLMLWDHPLPVPNHERVERLVHKELLNINYTYQCRACTGKGTPKTHKEWFQFDSDRASRVILRWNKWVYKSEPYDRMGNLKPFWRNRLENCRGYDLANGLRPQDTSKIPWSFENTAKFWDCWVEPSATEIWWFHLCRIINFSLEVFMLCVMALKDPANIRTAATSLMFMTVGSFALSMTQRLCLGAVCWIPVLLSNLWRGSDERRVKRVKKRVRNSSS